MPAPFSRDLLGKYLSGELSPDDAAQIQAYLESDPARRGFMAGIHAAIRGEELGARPMGAASWDEMLDRIGHVPPLPKAEVVGQPVVGEGRWRAVWYGVVGAVLGVLVIVAGWHVGASRLVRDRSQVAPMLTYTTANGERANITLPDGSTVALNVASRLEVPVDYARGNHTLHLNGEALFVVAHRDAVLFTVIAGQATTRVLGTSFVVRKYAADTNEMVAVRTGKVVVGAPGLAPLVLSANRQAEIGSHSARVQAASAAPFSFAIGILTLTGEPLSQSIAILDRWYDADIRLGDPALGRRRLMGEYAAGSLADMTELLAGAMDVRVVRHGRVVTLFPK